MTDLDPASVVTGVKFAMLRGAGPALPADYAITNTSERVVNYVLSTAFQHEFWSGLR
jgi:UDP-N-acetylglucosamine 2-epimerase (non-hydrolysing)